MKSMGVSSLALSKCKLGGVKHPSCTIRNLGFFFMAKKTHYCSRNRTTTDREEQTIFPPQPVDCKDEDSREKGSDSTGWSRCYKHISQQTWVPLRQLQEETRTKQCADRADGHLTPTWNRGAKRNKHHSSDWVFEADCAAEMRGQVARHSCQNANQRNGHKEAGPAVPVFGGRDKSEEDLPEDRQEVHNVIKAGRQTLLSALLLIVITWRRNAKMHMKRMCSTCSILLLRFPNTVWKICDG